MRAQNTDDSTAPPDMDGQGRSRRKQGWHWRKHATIGSSPAPRRAACQAERHTLDSVVDADRLETRLRQLYVTARCGIGLLVYFCSLPSWQSVLDFAGIPGDATANPSSSPSRTGGKGQEKTCSTARSRTEGLMKKCLSRRLPGPRLTADASFSPRATFAMSLGLRNVVNAFHMVPACHTAYRSDGEALYRTEQKKTWRPSDAEKLQGRASETEKSICTFPCPA